MGSSYDEIMCAMPILTVEDIRAIESYIEENKEEVMAEDRKICAENALLRNPPEVEKILEEARSKRMARMAARRNRQGENGEGHT